MNAVLVVVLVLLVGLALVVGGTGLLALIGKLPGNGALGVRTPETRRSPEAWQLANRAAGPAFLTSGVALGLGALALGLIGGWVGGLVVVVAVLGALALLNVAGLAGSRTAALWDATQDDDQGGCGCGPDGCGGHSGMPAPPTPVRAAPAPRATRAPPAPPPPPARARAAARTAPPTPPTTAA